MRGSRGNGIPVTVGAPGAQCLDRWCAGLDRRIGAPAWGNGSGVTPWPDRRPRLRGAPGRRVGRGGRGGARTGRPTWVRPGPPVWVVWGGSQAQAVGAVLTGGTSGGPRTVCLSPNPTMNQYQAERMRRVLLDAAVLLCQASPRGPVPPWAPDPLDLIGPATVVVRWARVLLTHLHPFYVVPPPHTPTPDGPLPRPTDGRRRRRAESPRVVAPTQHRIRAIRLAASWSVALQRMWERRSRSPPSTTRPCG